MSSWHTEPKIGAHAFSKIKERENDLSQIWDEMGAGWDSGTEESSSGTGMSDHDYTYYGTPGYHDSPGNSDSIFASESPSLSDGDSLCSSAEEGHWLTGQLVSPPA